MTPRAARLAPDLARQMEELRLYWGGDPEADRAREQYAAMLAVVLAAEKVHRRYLRQWSRHQNKAEEALGKALFRLDRVSQQRGPSRG